MASSGAEGFPSPPRMVPIVPSQWRWLIVEINGVATSASPGMWVAPEDCEPVDAPRQGPCPTASVGKRRTGCAVTRRRRERVSREGGGFTRRTAAQTRVPQISLKFGLAVEDGPYTLGTQPLKACSTVG